MSTYTFKHTVPASSTEKILLSSEAGLQRWVRIKGRKVWECTLCLQNIEKGSNHWTPKKISEREGSRICNPCMFVIERTAIGYRPVEHGDLRGVLVLRRGRL